MNPTATHCIHYIRQNFLWSNIMSSLLFGWVSCTILVTILTLALQRCLPPIRLHKMAAALPWYPKPYETKLLYRQLLDRMHRDHPFWKSDGATVDVLFGFLTPRTAIFTCSMHLPTCCGITILRLSRSTVSSFVQINAAFSLDPCMLWL